MSGGNGKVARKKDPVSGVRRDIFIGHLAKGWTVSAAAEIAGLTRYQVYGLRNRDPLFAKDWDNALETGDEVLEQEAFRRAVEGNAEPVFIKGEKVGEITKYSDQLLMFLLKGRKPERYRERVDLTSKGEGLASKFAQALMELPEDDGTRRPEDSPTQH